MIFIGRILKFHGSTGHSERYFDRDYDVKLAETRVTHGVTGVSAGAKVAFLYLTPLDDNRDPLRRAQMRDLDVPDLQEANACYLMFLKRYSEQEGRVLYRPVTSQQGGSMSMLRMTPENPDLQFLRWVRDGDARCVEDGGYGEAQLRSFRLRITAIDHLLGVISEDGAISMGGLDRFRDYCKSLLTTQPNKELQRLGQRDRKLTTSVKPCVGTRTEPAE